MAFLFQVGGVTFLPYPVTLETFDHDTGADFAKKDIIGAQRPSEAVGEGDDALNFTAILYPIHFGGLPTIDVLHAMRKSQDPQPVLRGDGTYYGWYVVEKVRATHTILNGQGIGKKIEVAITLAKIPNPSQGDMVSNLLSLF